VGHRVIEQGAGEVVTAIRAAVAAGLPSVVVSVYAAEPETAAAPCIWLRFLEARYAAARWSITYEAWIVADAGLGAVDAQRQLAAMTDAVLAIECPGVVATDMTARGGGLTTRIGEVAHPCHLATIPQLTQVC
jgi:hypothetical protein